MSTKAIEVMPFATSLNSNDVFVLHSQQFGSFLWFGRGCNGDEREMGRLVALHITGKREIDTVAEGQEPNEFWMALGGKNLNYSSGKAFEARGLPFKMKINSVSYKRAVFCKLLYMYFIIFIMTKIIFIQWEVRINTHNYTCTKWLSF